MAVFGILSVFGIGPIASTIVITGRLCLGSHSPICPQLSATGRGNPERGKFEEWAKTLPPAKGVDYDVCHLRHLRLLARLPIPARREYQCLIGKVFDKCLSAGRGKLCLLGSPAAIPKMPSATMTTNATSSVTETDGAIADLRRGASKLVTLSIRDRQRLLRDCVVGITRTWKRWVDVSWEAKRISAGDAARAEDIMIGPLPALRYLRLMHQTLDDIEMVGRPRFPGVPSEVAGRLQIPVFPTRSLFDRILFGPIRGYVRMRPNASMDGVFGDQLQRATGSADEEGMVTLVLGAGNVSAIPITDSLTKIFQDNQAVLLKMNPVNAYVGAVFVDAFAALIEADLLRIVYGAADVGARLIESDRIDRVHVTGSDRTHDAIVWGTAPEEQAERKKANRPRLTKPITSELGNVSPWIIVPGKYSRRQLRYQAENIVASITNNVSFLCIATKMLVTCRDWPQRELFLNMIDEILARIPSRYAYYPGASDRFSRFAGIDASDPDYLPWTLQRDTCIQDAPHLFREESFVCVFGETALAADSPEEFLRKAVSFVNEQMWGTLSAAVTVPDEFRKRAADDLNGAVDQLNYGIVGINQWPGVAFALMSTPWGGFPGSTLCDIQSGMGGVHNTYLIEGWEKTVLSSPLTIFPKPVWFSTHRYPEAVAKSLLHLYLHPTARRVPSVLLNAIRG